MHCGMAETQTSPSPPSTRPDFECHLDVKSVHGVQTYDSSTASGIHWGPASLALWMHYSSFLDVFNACPLIHASAEWCERKLHTKPTKLCCK